MDVSLLTKLAAAGAMGVSIYCIIKVYDLLKNEQRKETPRPVFIKTIYVSMGFAIMMTFLSLGIEIVRHYMDNQINQLEIDLDKIAGEDYYSVNSNGNPKEIKLTYKKPYILSKAFSKNNFEQIELKLKKAANERYLAVNQNLNDEIILGYFSKDQIKDKTKDLFADIIDNALDYNELWALGICYTPDESIKAAKSEVKKDRSLANEYLIKFLKHKNVDNVSKKEKALKILVQPRLMNRLLKDQYPVLINALQSGIRETPWDKYELAQVYLSRSGQTWNKQKSESDKVIFKKLLKEYVVYYEKNKWIQNKNKYPTEYKWYKECKTTLNN